MDRKEKLKDIWAMTDKPLIDAMKKKSPQFPTTLNDSSSDDSTSDSASDSDSDFSALPEEFRPNLSIERTSHKENTDGQIPLSQTFRNKVPYDKKAFGNATSNMQTATKRIENQDQNRKPNHSPHNLDVDSNSSMNMNSAGKKDELMGRSKTDTLLKKKTIQYEYKQRPNRLEEPYSILLKSDNRSTREKIISPENGISSKRLTPSAAVRLKNIPDVEDRIPKQKFHNDRKKNCNSKRDLLPSSQLNNIKWDDSLSFESENNSKVKRNWVQFEKRVPTGAEKLGKKIGARKKSSSELENICKFNNSRPNEMRESRYSKSSSTCCSTAKHAEARPKDDKNSIEFIFKENNLHSVNERKIKYDYLTEQVFNEEEIQNLNRTYEKDSKNNIRKQNRLSQSSPNDTLGLPRAHQHKPVEDLLQNDDSSPFRDRTTADKSSQNLEEQRNCILHYGKEVSNLIIGSYTALSMLVSFYREWTVARRELISIFKQLERNLLESSKTYLKYTDIIKVAQTGSVLASNIPHPAFAMTAKIVSIITSLLQTLLKPKKDQVNFDDSDEVTRAMIKDNQTTSELQMHVLQCSQQFEETAKLITEFHSNSKIQKYFDNENLEITSFIKGFLEYKPDHRIFYKKLHKCFSELLQTSSTSFSKRFCEPFSFYLSATEVIEYLGWRFRSEDFDSTSVNHELEAISCLIQAGNNTTVEDLLKRIRSCISILTDELYFREKCMKDISLFDTSPLPLQNKYF